MQYCYKYFRIIFHNRVNILLCIVALCVLGCAGIGQIDSEKKQLQAIKDKLGGYRLSKLEPACDGCQFLGQEAISRQRNSIDPKNTSLSRAQSGVKVYVFKQVSLEDAFIMLLNSNIFARRINKGYKIALMDSIASGKNDFYEKDLESKLDFQTFSSLKFGKRLKGSGSEPKAQLDSVEIMYMDNGNSWRYSDSLESFIVGGEIVIIHYYSQNEIWAR